MNKLTASFLKAMVGCIFVLGLTTGLSGKEEGYYLHGGVTYWNGLEAPEFSGSTGVEDVTTESELDGSRAQLSLGVGYNLDEQWGFEAFYVATPETVISASDWMFPPLPPNFEPFTVSWTASVKRTVFGLAAVYDLYINENLALFGKAGVALVRHTSETSLTTSIEPDFVGSVIPTSFTDDEDTQDLFGAVGARIPILSGDASITFAYQFVETSDERETNFEIGFQWHL